MHAGNVKGTFCLHCLCFRVYKKPPVFRGLKFSFISFFCALLFRPYLSKQVWILKHKPCRWWTVSRGLQKSPLETFVRGFAAPPCSTPVPMSQKKNPKKLCAFWGFISVPVVGVEPTRCHHQRILSPSRLPIPTHRLICCLYSILQAPQKIKIYFVLFLLSCPACIVACAVYTGYNKVNVIV